MYMKMVVSKEQYEQVRQVEKMLGVKIALAPEEHQLRVVDCLNGQWGIYQIKRCYKSATKYFAELKLIEPATTEQEAINTAKKGERREIKSSDLLIRGIGINGAGW